MEISCTLLWDFWNQIVVQIRLIKFQFICCHFQQYFPLLFNWMYIGIYKLQNCTFPRLMKILNIGIDIEGRSQSWPPIFPGMESNLGVFGFTRKVRESTASFCDMSVFFNRARKAATSATHIKVIARVICIAHSPQLFSAKSRIPPNCSPCREKIYVGGIETLGSLSLYLWT